MNLSKRIISFALGGIILATSTLSFATPSEEQMDIWLKERSTITSQWSKFTVSKAYEFGLVDNTELESHTDLRMDMSRKEFVEVAMNYVRTHTTQFKLNQIKRMLAEPSFKDTKDKNIIEASHLGIVSGKGEGNFSPNDNITREQVATMLVRVEKIVNGSNPQVYEDIVLAGYPDALEVSVWAKHGMALLIDGGIISGNGDGFLAPNYSITREEAIQIMVSLFSRKEESVISEVQ